MAGVPLRNPLAAEGRGRPFWIGLALFVLLLLVTLLVWVLALDAEVMGLPGFELSAREVVVLIESWGMWAVAGSIGLMIAHSFVPFPAELVAMANGMLWGPFWGTLITWTGAMLGAFLAFGLARWLGRPFVLQMVARRQHAALDRWAERQGAGALLFSRFIPVISFNLINYAAGLTSISWWTFAWATGIGILPLTFLMVLMGDGLWSGGERAWLWLVAAAALAWPLWWLAKRRRAKRLADR